MALRLANARAPSATPASKVPMARAGCIEVFGVFMIRNPCSGVGYKLLVIVETEKRGFPLVFISPRTGQSHEYTTSTAMRQRMCMQVVARCSRLYIVKYE